MAEDASQSRTEVASARRRRQARERGDVAFSGELASATALLTTLAILLSNGPWLWSRMAQLVRLQMGQLNTHELTSDATVALLAVVMQFIGAAIGPLMAGAFVISLVTGFLQTGQNITWQPLNPNWERLMPGRGLARIFSMRTSARMLVMFVKVALVTAVVSGVVRSHQREWFATPVTEFEPLVGNMGTVVAELSWILVGCFVAVGIADYGFQRWKYEQDLMMSRQELKEERKEEEGDAHIRSLRRRRQREMLRQQIERDVPKATVIVTNPTHFAVALKYERGKMSAPQVVAKGQDVLARRIIALASRHNIPVVRKPELARALYKSVRVGKAVPSHMFRAVAEIIAYLYRSQARRPSTTQELPRRAA